MYIIILIYLFFCSFISNRILAVFNIFVTFSLMSCWYFPAYDWINYHDFYANIGAVGLLNGTFEPGFTALMKISSFFGFEYHAVYMLSNAIIYFFVYRYCMTFRCPGFVFFFIFALFGFVLFSEQIRQGIALSILLFASRRNKFIAYALVACLFHYSAIFAVGLEFIINNKNKNHKKTIYIIFGAVLAAALLLIFGSNTAFVELIKSKIANHLNFNVLAPSFIFGLLLYFIFPLFCLYKKYNNLVSKKWQYFCFAIILLGVPFPVFNRFTYYCYPYLIPDIEYLFGRYLQRGLILASIIFVMGLRIVISPIYLPLMNDYNYFIPGITQSPDYESIHKERCIILRNNGINDFC